MKRKIEIASICLFVLLGVTAILVTRSGREEAPTVSQAGPSVIASPGKEIIIRNITKREVVYEVKPLGSLGTSEKRRLKSGGIDRFAARREFLVSYQRSGSEVVERLSPGSAYCFRYDENDLVHLYLGSHMREDADDLAPYVPTPIEVAEKMLEMAQVSRADLVYDLGCGDGRIVILAAKKYRARGVGIDIDPARIQEAETAAEEAGVKNLVTFKVEDAMKTDFSTATVVTIYLLPESNALLKPLFEKHLKSGARVVSHNYTIPGWEDRETDSATMNDQTGNRHTIFMYRFSAR